jgi:hypothetical protein
MWDTVKATFSHGYQDPAARDLLDEPVQPVHTFNPLVQIESDSQQEMRV